MLKVFNREKGVRIKNLDTNVVHMGRLGQMGFVFTNLENGKVLHCNGNFKIEIVCMDSGEVISNWGILYEKEYQEKTDTFWADDEPLIKIDMTGQTM